MRQSGPLLASLFQRRHADHFRLSAQAAHSALVEVPASIHATIAARSAGDNFAPPAATSLAQVSEQPKNPTIRNPRRHCGHQPTVVMVRRFAAGSRWIRTLGPCRGELC